MTPLQLNLNLLSDVIDEFADTLGVSLTDKDLVFIYDNGEALDNWEALNQFISELEGHTVATRERLLGLMHSRFKTKLYFMRLVNLKNAKPYYKEEVYGRLPPDECKALAMTMVLLVEHDIKRQKLRYVGQADGMAMLTHLATWGRTAVYNYCLSKLLSRERCFYQTLAELLPTLVNQFYHKTIVPWMLCGGVPQ